MRQFILAGFAYRNHIHTCIDCKTSIGQGGGYSAHVNLMFHSQKHRYPVTETCNAKCEYVLQKHRVKSRFPGSWIREQLNTDFGPSNHL